MSSLKAREYLASLIGILMSWIPNERKNLCPLILWADRNKNLEVAKKIQGIFDSYWIKYPNPPQAIKSFF